MKNSGITRFSIFCSGHLVPLLDYGKIVYLFMLVFDSMQVTSFLRVTGLCSVGWHKNCMLMQETSVKTVWSSLVGILQINWCGDLGYSMIPPRLIASETNERCKHIFDSYKNPGENSFGN